MKRKILILMCTMLAMLIMAGCGKSEVVSNSEATKEETSKAEATNAESSNEKVTNVETSKVEASIEETKSQEESQASGNSYVFIVNNQDGVGVEGVSIQVCTDEMCQMIVTDENGVAQYDGEPMAYEVHVLKFPEGYTYDKSKVYTTSDSYETVTFVLENK